MTSPTSTIASPGGRPHLSPAHSAFHTRALAVTAALRISAPKPHLRLNVGDPELGEPSLSSQPSAWPSHQKRMSSGGFRSPTKGLDGQAPHQLHYRWMTGDAVGGATGDEPGVDVRSRRDEEAYSHLNCKANIKVVEYSNDPDDKDFQVEFDGERLGEWLETEGSKRSISEDGKPRNVRWINVEGLNWEVVKTLTLHYGLHPLAVEDALRASGSPRSKLDFYRSHLYCQILVQYTHHADEEAFEAAAESLADSHMDALPIGSRIPTRKPGLWDQLTGHSKAVVRGMQLPEGVEGVFEPSVGGTRLQRGRSPYQKDAHRMTVDHLSAKYMVPIRRALCSLFMTRDGTMITITRGAVPDMLAPIYDRLEDEQSLLRKSGDVSMLAQALLDVSVDLATEITQTFESEILQLEASVLVDPSMETVRHLHVLSSQLIRLRRSLTPLLNVVHIIRDQDTQRSAAATALTTHARPQDKHHLSRDTQWLAAPPGPSSPGGNPETGSIRSYLSNGAAGGVPMAAQASLGVYAPGQAGSAFFSPLTKVYIGDVMDHLETIVGSMDQFVATCDHLTDYVFNVLSFQTNASMERLSIVTVVFLPLTFIASYFGMNFTQFDQIEGPVGYFWQVAAPCTFAFFFFFSFGYIRRGFETFLRRLGRWRRMRLVEKQAMGTGRRKMQ